VEKIKLNHLFSEHLFRHPSYIFSFTGDLYQGIFVWKLSNTPVFYLEFLSLCWYQASQQTGLPSIPFTSKNDEVLEEAGSRQQGFTFTVLDYISWNYSDNSPREILISLAMIRILGRDSNCI